MGLPYDLPGVQYVYAQTYILLSSVVEDDFLYNTTWAYRMIYLVASMSMHRPMYYFAWKLGKICSFHLKLFMNNPKHCLANEYLFNLIHF